MAGSGLGRRDFLRLAAGAAAGLALPGCRHGAGPAGAQAAPRFELGVCQWAYHEGFQRGELDALEFPSLVVREHRVAGLDWVSTLFRRPGSPASAAPSDAQFFAELRREIAPFARAVSAKSHAFDAAGDETTIDFPALLRILAEAGFRGWTTAEYEGPGDPALGTEQTLALLRRVETELAAPADRAPRGD